jgi:predicted transcriptional regulator
MMWSLNKTEVLALRLLRGKSRSVSELAGVLSKSLSFTSESVRHLGELGLAERERRGNRVSVSLSATPLSQSLALLMSEEPMLNLEALFSGSGLRLLPLLLEPGSSANELASRSGLSLRSVKGYLPRWRRMGVVLLTGGKYSVNLRYKLLADFLRKFSEYRNNSFLHETFPQAVIVWQWRDEFMFSVDIKIKDPKFVPAGVSRLDDFEYELVHTNEYYLYRTDKTRVSEEEALVQALYVDPDNPRIKRLFKVHWENVNKEKLLELASKYGLKTKIGKMVMRDG